MTGLVQHTTPNIRPGRHEFFVDPCFHRLVLLYASDPGRYVGVESKGMCSHIMRSACLVVKRSNRWVTKISTHLAVTGFSERWNISCSAVGSRAELGSSVTANRMSAERKPTELRALNILVRPVGSIKPVALQDVASLHLSLYFVVGC